jgi:hypothetical protein
VKKQALLISLLMVSCVFMLWLSSRDIPGNVEQGSNQAAPSVAASEPKDTAESSYPTIVSRARALLEQPIDTIGDESPVVPDQSDEVSPHGQQQKVLEVEARNWKDRLREQYRQEGLYQDIAVREADWKERSKRLIVGMTLEEVITVMGAQPNWTNTLPPEISRETFIDYTPDPNSHPFRVKLGLPYDNLSLVLDVDGRLSKIQWLRQ